MVDRRGRARSFRRVASLGVEVRVRPRSGHLKFFGHASRNDVLKANRKAGIVHHRKSRQADRQCFSASEGSRAVIAKSAPSCVNCWPLSDTSSVTLSTD